MVGVINPPCVGNGINSTGSFNDYKALAEAVTSVGPPPSAIQGGQLVSTYPTGTPTGTNGPYFTGFSASCTAGTNTSSNSTESTTTSAISSATTSGTSSGTSSASISATQPVSSSKGERVYGVSFRNQDLPSLVWQVGYQLGLIGAVLLAFM
jgi:hypothetical protein